VDVPQDTDYNDSRTKRKTDKVEAAMIETVNELVNAIRQHRLLEPAQVDELSELQAKFTAPRALARELMDRDWLTPYQLNQLFQGRGPDLILGSYVLVERLGEGAMGQVFKAKHQRMRRFVALKLIREDLLSQAHAVERFYQEIQAASQLSHANIIHPYDAGPIGRTHFFAMEYVRGIDLQRLVEQSGPLPMDMACAFIHQTCLGLQHAFEKGLLHRDLKPTNLSVTKRSYSGEYKSGGSSWPASLSTFNSLLKIRNLGLTFMQPPAEDWSSPGTNVPLRMARGTPDYLAPERARQNPSLDVRSDLYSLGCTFYFMLTGQVPFPGGTLAEKLRRHESEEPAAIDLMRKDVAAEVIDMVRKLMAKNPGDRYQAPVEVAAALETFLKHGS